MLKPAMIVASVLSAIVVIAFVSYGSIQQKKQYLSLSEELAKIKQAADQRAQELTNSQARIEALVREKEEATRGQHQMEEQMREALKTRDVTISELQGKLTVNILDRVLFDSGEAELKPEGEAIMKQIAEVLAKYPERQVYVIGHTDNVPIRFSAFSRYANNWELSTGRALSAVRFLTEKAGVAPGRLAAVGYGEHHPIADNSTPEGRSRNRRIAIVVMPEKFNPLESLPTSGSTNAPAQTNAPAVPVATPAPTNQVASASTNAVPTAEPKKP